MNIRICPELEKLMEEDIQRGPYQSVDEFVERAVSLLHEQEVWLAEHRTEIGAKTEEGYAAAKRGELLDSGSLRPLMDERKTFWLSGHQNPLPTRLSSRKRSS
jgi:Arc/MetJ-type ribon-helix-helix transcriptional regulator